jgi:hypothetical protein
MWSGCRYFLTDGRIQQCTGRAFIVFVMCDDKTLLIEKQQNNVRNECHCFVARGLSVNLPAGLTLISGLSVILPAG